MPTFINKFRDEIDFTDSTAATLADHPRPFVDLKTTTLDGAIRKIVEEYYKKDITSGITEFPAQILRVEQRVGRFEKSYLDNLGREINRELNRRYKVKVVIVDDLKEAPKTFDETSEDREVIDSYPDFVYIPYSFGNSEPMNVGDFVMVTYGNLLSHQDGRIIYKISGGPHVQGSVGKPKKHKSVKSSDSAKKAFKEKPKREEKPTVEVPDAPPVTTTPAAPKQPEPESPEQKKRTLKDTGWFNAENLKEYNLQNPNNKIETFEDYQKNWYKTKKRTTIHLETLNTDLTKRKKPDLKEIYIDFKLPENKKYKRASMPSSNADDIYIRAFLDSIATFESDINFGWDLLFRTDAHPEDLSLDKFKDFSQHPARGSFNNGSMSTAAGRYQFTYTNWSDNFEKKYKSLEPNNQDLAAEEGIYGRLKKLSITKEGFISILKENTNDSFRKIFQNYKSGGKYYALVDEWTSLPRLPGTEGNIGANESRSKQYTGTLVPKSKYKYTPELFRQIYNLLLEDQKRILNGEETKNNNRQEIINKAIEKTVEETKILVNQEEDPKKKIEISQKILGSNNVPVLQPVNGKPAEGAVVAQATQGNGRKKLG